MKEYKPGSLFGLDHILKVGFVSERIAKKKLLLILLSKKNIAAPEKFAKSHMDKAEGHWKNIPSTF